MRADRAGNYIEVLKVIRCAGRPKVAPSVNNGLHELRNIEMLYSSL